MPGSAGRPESRGSDPVLARAAQADLVAAVLRRDRKAAAQFVAAHIDAIYSYVRYRLLPRTDLVEDVVQDVFLAALKGLASFQGQSSLRTWLLGIARHKVEDLYRQRLHGPEALDEVDEASEGLVAATATLDEQIDAARAQEKMRHLLARLPERYGLLLLWRYWERRSTREIAHAIGTTEKGAERMLARARARFKELWLKE
jgi:RNA polymerase sigma-70 factor, ECF subfamily